jgi:ankyrin repeat protein
LVQALIEAGADINEVYNLESLLRITISLNKLAEATLLMKAPGFDQNLHRLCLTENLFVDNIDDAFYSLLIAKGADIDFQNPEGNTPLHVAIAKGDDRKANLLIENGANLSLKNRENETVLHIAIRQQRLLLVKLLISKGGMSKPSQMPMQTCCNLP